MSGEFQGHVAFVTGGASGIGAQVCRDLAEQGASVVVADLNIEQAEALVASLPTGDQRQHLSIRLEVANKSEVDEAVEKVISKYGQPADLIVNAAGIGPGLAPLEDLKEEDVDRVMNVNFKGTFLVTQAFGRALLNAGKPGSIVNISSILAYSACWETMSHYCASKAAVMQFSKVAAKEWGPKKIRVNSVHPGMIDTPLTAFLRDNGGWTLYESRASLGRIGQPKEVSNAILFLLSDKSSFITGVPLEISGQGY